MIQTPFNLHVFQKSVSVTKYFESALRANECKDQSACPIVSDMGLLTKAVEIVWARHTEFEGVLTGGIQFMISVFACIGHLYGDAGLKYFMMDSGVWYSITGSFSVSEAMNLTSEV
jgi:hypothetical protein